MLSSYRIRDIEISPNLVLAPMSGVTCSAFRRLIKEINPGCVGYVLTEFVSVEGMTRSSQRTFEMMRFREMERPIAVQIFGYDVARMRDAAMIVQDHGADIVDINCGCPAPKVVKRGGGAELMRQPDHLSQIFREVRKVLKIPLTMKMRSGWDACSTNCVDIARMAESEGIEAIAVHGRTRAQLYHGDADWSFVEHVINSVKIPVCGSGDVIDIESAKKRLSIPGLAGLYIGRGAMENPLVFSEIAGRSVQPLNSPSPESSALAVAITKRYIELLREDFPDRVCVGRVKQLVSQMARRHLWRKGILRAMNLNEQLEILERANSFDTHSAPATNYPSLC